jgi:hypothetical protein
LVCNFSTDWILYFWLFVYTISVYSTFMQLTLVDFGWAREVEIEMQLEANDKLEDFKKKEMFHIWITQNKWEDCKDF